MDGGFFYRPSVIVSDPCAYYCADVLIYVVMPPFTLRMVLSQKAWSDQMESEVFETPGVVTFNLNRGVTIYLLNVTPCDQMREYCARDSRSKEFEGLAFLYL